MAALRKKLLTASNLATLCEVDLKTIHNWVDRGRISHFRTPGRHLRFRAADVADFLRTWGYSVPRELSGEGARALMVVGPDETLALVNRVLGEGGAPAIPPPSPSGVTLSPSGSKRASPSEPPGALPEEARPVPIRHFAHPYDALIHVGAEVADVYIVDLAALSAESISSGAFLEALHRASPRATFVALSAEPVELPPFALKIGRGDARALEAILLPEGEPASDRLPSNELPLGLVAAGAG